MGYSAKDYAISEEQAGKLAQAKRKKRRRQSWYLKGPINGDWLALAASLPGRALHVAIAVQHVAHLRRAKTILLERKWCDRLGVSTSSEKRNLDRLEGAGLISVQRQTGARPRVTIRYRRTSKRG